MKDVRRSFLNQNQTERQQPMDTVVNVAGLVLLMLVVWMLIRRAPAIRDRIPFPGKRKNEDLLRACDALLTRSDIDPADREVLERARNSLMASGKTESWAGEDFTTAARREIQEIQSRYETHDGLEDSVEGIIQS